MTKNRHMYACHLPALPCTLLTRLNQGCGVFLPENRRNGGHMSASAVAWWIKAGLGFMHVPAHIHGRAGQDGCGDDWRGFCIAWQMWRQLVENCWSTKDQSEIEAFIFEHLPTESVKLSKASKRRSLRKSKKGPLPPRHRFDMEGLQGCALNLTCISV